MLTVGSDTVADYNAAIDFIFSRINFERAVGRSWSHTDLRPDRMARFLELLGDPHLRIPTIHVAGTKGKGSTSAMLASMLSASGLRTGLFTSPHITVFEERMTVDGRPPCGNEFTELLNLCLDAIARLDALDSRMSPTFFEIALAMAWLMFDRNDCNLAVLETGLGGRLDATNTCQPLLCIITNISRDHTAILGESTAQIAAEKAGIIKRQVPVITGDVDPDADRAIEDAVVSNHSIRYRANRDFDFDCTSRGRTAFAGETLDLRTPWRNWSQVHIPLTGEHQAANAALAIVAADYLDHGGYRITLEEARRGLDQLVWPLRFEVVDTNPTTIVDAAHNEASVAAVVHTLRRRGVPENCVLVFAASRDKDAGAMLAHLMPDFRHIIFTRYTTNPRSAAPGDLADLVDADLAHNLQLTDDPSTALATARRLAGSGGLICVTGSFFLAAEIRGLIVDER